VKDPEYVITVVVDDADLPPEKNYGGLVAAPIFAAIGGKILNLKGSRHSISRNDARRHNLLGKT